MRPLWWTLFSVVTFALWLPNVAVTSAICGDDLCLNGGSCFDDNGFSRCFCVEGYSGERCEIPDDKCNDNLCYPGSTCVNHIHQYSCECAEDRMGQFCELENPCAVDKNPCLHGRCNADPRNNSYTCICDEGFTGPNCDIDVDECQDKNRTCVRGKCMNTIGGFRCQCDAGFEGALCNTMTDYCHSQPCANGATCLSLEGTYRCLCLPGWMGDACEEPKAYSSGCTDLVCMHGGTCEKSVEGERCHCLPCFFGPTCGKLKQEPCNNDEQIDGNFTNYDLTDDDSRREKQKASQYESWIIIFLAVVISVVIASTVVCVTTLHGRKRKIDATRVFIPPGPPASSIKDIDIKTDHTVNGYTMTPDDNIFTDIENYPLPGDPRAKRPRLMAYSYENECQNTDINFMVPLMESRVFTKLHEMASQAGRINQFDDALMMCLGIPDERGRFPLHWVVDSVYDKSEDDIIADIQLLLNHGESVSVQDDAGLTPLHIAIRRLRFTAAFFLMDETSVNLVDAEGFTPLHDAIAVCNIEIVEELVSKFRVDVNHVVNGAYTLLDKAIRMGEPGVPILEILLRCRELDVNKVASRHEVDFTGATALHVAAQVGNVEAINRLIYRGATITACDKHTETPLHYAVRNGDLNSVRTLVMFGGEAVMSMVSDLGTSPLALAENEGLLEVAHFLRNSYIRHHKPAAPVLMSSYGFSPSPHLCYQHVNGVSANPHYGARYLPSTSEQPPPAPTLHVRRHYPSSSSLPSNHLPLTQLHTHRTPPPSAALSPGSESSGYQSISPTTIATPSPYTQMNMQELLDEARTSQLHFFSRR